MEWFRDKFIKSWPKKQEEYKISNNKHAFEEDALKIQNLITGGYYDDE